MFAFDKLPYCNVPTPFVTFECGSNVNLAVQGRFALACRYEDDKCILTVRPVRPCPWPHPEMSELGNSPDKHALVQFWF